MKLLILKCTISSPTNERHKAEPDPRTNEFWNYLITRGNYIIVVALKNDQPHLGLQRVLEIPFSAKPLLKNLKCRWKITNTCQHLFQSLFSLINNSNSLTIFGG